MSLKIASRGLSPALSSVRVRDIFDRHTFPENLQASINKYYENLSWRKRLELKKIFSKKKSPATYTVPVIPNIKQASKFLKDYETLHEITSQRYKEEQKVSKDASRVDQIMYRSLPSLVYLSDRMFSEIRAFDQNFAPYSMLDMGSNLGSSVWAIQKYYGDTIGDYVLHEHTKDEYNRTVALLNNKYDPYIENVSVKGRFSMPKAEAFDVVTAINYFPYLQDYEIRGWLKKIWAVTGSYLVIADISNRFTALRMAKIRNLFINMYSDEGTILAPCPHAQHCPLLKSKDSHVCRFKLTPVPPPSKRVNKAPLLHRDFDYSYLILKRGLDSQADSDYARLLRPIVFHNKSNRNLEMTTCNSDGTMWKTRVNRLKSLELYKHIYKKQSGDVVDQAWWNHHFNPGSIAWSNIPHEESILRQKKKNERKRVRKSIDALAEQYLDEGQQSSVELDEDGLGFSPDNMPVGNDQLDSIFTIVDSDNRR